MIDILNKFVGRDSEKEATTKYISDIELDRLRIDGRKLVERKLKGETLAEAEIDEWLAHVSTVLETALGDNSPLSVTFKEYAKSVKGNENTTANSISERPPEDPGNGQPLVDAVSTTNKIDKYDQKTLEGFVSHTNLYLNHASEIVLQNKSEQELGYQIEKYFTKHFFKNEFFWIPIILLAGAVAFATVGVVQLETLRVDVREVAATAEQHAYQNIATQIGSIQNDLNTLATANVNNISATLVAIQNNLDNQANNAAGSITGTAGAIQNNLDNQANTVAGNITGTVEAIQNNLDSQATTAAGNIIVNVGTIQSKLNTQAAVAASEIPATVAAFPTAIVMVATDFAPLKQNVDELTNRIQLVEGAATAVAQAQSQGSGTLGEISNLVLTHSALLFGAVILAVFSSISATIFVFIKSRKT